MRIDIVKHYDEHKVCLNIIFLWPLFISEDEHDIVRIIISGLHET